MIKLKVFPTGIMCNETCVTRNTKTTKAAFEGKVTPGLLKALRYAGIYKAVDEEISFERMN